MSIAYLLGKGSSRALRTKINIPTLLVLSILPDIDIIYDFLTGSELHRGPTHSIVFAFLVFIPFFIVYRKKAVPYFLALISHAFIGDFIVGGQLELLWPFTTQQFGLHELGGPFINIFNNVNVFLEMFLFLSAMAVMYKTSDWQVFFEADLTNLVLIIPITTVILPSTVGYPFSASLLFTEPTLAFAHIVFLVLFSIAVLKTLRYLCKKWFRHTPNPHPPPRLQSEIAYTTSESARAFKPFFCSIVGCNVYLTHIKSEDKSRQNTLLERVFWIIKKWKVNGVITPLFFSTCLRRAVTGLSLIAEYSPPKPCVGRFRLFMLLTS